MRIYHRKTSWGNISQAVPATSLYSRLWQSVESKSRFKIPSKCSTCQEKAGCTAALHELQQLIPKNISKKLNKNSGLKSIKTGRVNAHQKSTSTLELLKSMGLPILDLNELRQIREYGQVKIWDKKSINQDISRSSHDPLIQIRYQLSEVLLMPSHLCRCPQIKRDVSIHV